MWCGRCREPVHMSAACATGTACTGCAAATPRLDPWRLEVRCSRKQQVTSAPCMSRVHAAGEGRCRSLSSAVLSTCKPVTDLMSVAFFSNVLPLAQTSGSPSGLREGQRIDDVATD